MVIDDFHAAAAKYQIIRFIEAFEREAAKNGGYRDKLDPSALAFLENVWGPVFSYDFSGLKAEFPFRDMKGGQRFADFVYVRNGIRLAIEVDGFTTHARDITPGEFNDHLTRQNDLVLSGWLLLRFSAWQVNKRAEICRRQLLQAVGHAWSSGRHKLAGSKSTLWDIRRNLIKILFPQKLHSLTAC